MVQICSKYLNSICVCPDKATHKNIKQTKGFGVNLCSTDQRYWELCFHQRYIQCYRRNAMQKIESSAKSAKDIVMGYLQAYDRRDFQAARGYLSNNMSYVSPVNSFDRAEPYLKYFEHLNLPKFDIKKEFVDSNDVCILHEYKIGTPPVTSLACAWFHVDDDRKISSIRVVFDPRPFVQQK